MYFSEKVPVFVFLFFIVLAQVVYIVRMIKVMKRNNYKYGDAFADDNIGKKFRKEIDHKFYLYWILMVLGVILMVVLALINKQ